MTRLLFIHGINNEGKSAETIRQNWGAALNVGMKAAGLEEIDINDIECAYYGDILEKGTKKWKENKKHSANKELKIENRKKLEKELRDAFSPRALVTLEKTTTIVSNKKVKKIFEVIEPEGGNEKAAGPHKGSLIAGAKLLELISPKIIFKLVSLILDQAIAYLEDKKLHKKINEQVIEQLFSDKSKKNEPHIVVSHSNGTILSYLLFSDVLKHWNIKALYTIGSPLGAKTMQRYLPNTSHYPGKVKTWYNCWDPEDFVSYNTPLNKKTINIDGIININTFNTDNKDKHSIVSYLSHAMLARLINHDYRTE